MATTLQPILWNKTGALASNSNTDILEADLFARVSPVSPFLLVF